MKKFSIYSSFTKDNKEKREELKKELKAHGFKPNRDGELLIVIGGDGTFLSAIRKRYEENPIFVGFNTGNLGFFSEFTLDKCDQFISMLKKGDYRIDELPLYEIRYKEDGVEKSEYFFNELSIERKSTRALHMVVQKNGKKLCHIDGDGVIISSSIGSTGYNLSAGGPIVTKKDRILVTPNNPLPVSDAYQSIQDSIILRNDCELTVFPSYKKQRPLRLVCDSREIRLEENVKYVTIRKAPFPIRFLRTKNFNDLANIRHKFLDE